MSTVNRATAAKVAAGEYEDDIVTYAAVIGYINMWGGASYKLARSAEQTARIITDFNELQAPHAIMWARGMTAQAFEDNANILEKAAKRDKPQLYSSVTDANITAAKSTSNQPAPKGQQ